MLKFKTRDLAFGNKELVKHPKNIRFENNENARIIFEIKSIGNDKFELTMLGDRRVVDGEHILYVW